MESVCAECSGGPSASNIKVISAISGSRICRCGACGAFWMEDGGCWEMILSPVELGMPGSATAISVKRRSA